MNEIAKKIHATLFYTGEEYSKSYLLNKFSINKEQLSECIAEIRQSVENTGLILIETDEKVILTFNESVREVVKAIDVEAYTGTLSNSALETLSIIAYASPISKVDLDFLRGVNSQFILRRLQMRGLIEECPNPRDRRTKLLQPTTEYLAFMKVSKVDELPEYGEVRENIYNMLGVMQEQIDK